MKMADILRNLADKLDGIDQGGGINPPSNTEKSVDDGTDSVHGDVELKLNPIMLPPLQAKLELLKKATGIDNIYDDEGSSELNDIKKLTGIRAVIQHEASEDNDVLG